MNIQLYNISIKIHKYLDSIDQLISTNLKNKISKIVSTYKEDELCFSHGDLIPTNIIESNGKIYFIDWEWCELRDSSYDIILFLLFSGKSNYMVSRIKNYISDNKLYSAYINLILIALRELKNWQQEAVYTIKKVHYINMWKSVLKKGVKFVESLNFASIK